VCPDWHSSAAADPRSMSAHRCRADIDRTATANLDSNLD
jgi:hypothetical protein